MKPVPSRGPSPSDTLTLPVGNYMSAALPNYVSENPSNLGNFMSADNRHQLDGHGRRADTGLHPRYPLCGSGHPGILGPGGRWRHLHGVPGIPADRGRPAARSRAAEIVLASCVSFAVLRALDVWERGAQAASRLANQ